MARGERIILVAIFFIIALALFFHSLQGRYQWIPGQDFAGKVFMPRSFDTWTGRTQPLF